MSWRGGAGRTSPSTSPRQTTSKVGRVSLAQNELSHFSSCRQMPACSLKPRPAPTPSAKPGSDRKGLAHRCGVAPEPARPRRRQRRRDDAQVSRSRSRCSPDSASLSSDPLIDAEPSGALMESARTRDTPASRHSLRRKPARATLLTKSSGASGRFSGHPASTQPSLTPH